MGFFSEIAGEVRRNDEINRSADPRRPGPAPGQAAPAPAPSPFPAPVQAIPESAQTPSEPAPAPDSASGPVSVQPESPPDPIPEPAPEETSAPAPAIDLTDHADDETERRKAYEAAETKRRKEHETAEAKRKDKWDRKQAKKKAEHQAVLDKIKAMNDAELLTAAASRVAVDTERLTRRNMKEAVAEHIQAKCREDSAFAVLVMDPEKSMMNCFRYINRKAREYAEQEMKDQGIKRTGIYGLDVPDGLVYQWSEDYFNDPDAEEDHEGEEKFIPKPYIPAAFRASKPKAEKKPAEEKPAAKPKPEKPAMEQISLM